MAANTQPIFSKQGAIRASGPLLAANAATDGTGAVTTIITGTTTDNAAGNFLARLVARPLGTNVQSVARIFWNNGASNAVAANNALIAEITLPATTVAPNVAMPGIEVPLNLALPPGHNLNVALGTAVAGGWVFTVIGGDY